MKKIFILMMMLLLGSLSLGSVFADLTTNNILWYSFDTNNVSGTSILDLSGNDYDGICTGFSSSCGTIVGLLNQATDLDGSNDFILNENSIAWKSYSFWFRGSSFNGGYTALGYNYGSNTFLQFNSDGTIRFTLGTFQFITTSTYDDNEWHNIIVTNGKFYIDNQQVGSTSAWATQSITKLYIGQLDSRTGFNVNIDIDEFALFSDILTIDEISELYNGGSGFNPYSISTPTIQNNVQDFYNTENITIQLNTTTPSNYTIFLDDVEVASYTNTTSEILQLFEVSEGAHSILFVSEDSNGQVNSSANFTIDLTAPVINNNSIPVKISSYSLDLENKIDFTEVNLDTCIISWSDSTTSNCDDDEKVFTYAGDYNYTITITDLAGNSISQDYSILVSPFSYVYFKTPDNIRITNFSLDGVEYGDYAELSFDQFGVGSHILLFEKTGFATTNITVTFQAAVNFNVTKIIKYSYLNVEIRDRDTRNLITKSVILDLTGESFAKRYTTSTGKITITDIKELPDTYSIQAILSDYATLDYYFTHTGYKEVNITLYMLNLTKEPTPEPIKLILRDEYYEAKKDCLFKVKQQFVTIDSVYNEFVDMAYTNSIGEVIFYLEFSKKYQWVIECDGLTQTEPNQKITNNIIYIDWQPGTIYPNIPDFPNIEGDVMYIDNTTKYFKFEWNNKDNTPVTACLEVSKQLIFEKEIIGKECITTPAGTLYVDLDSNTNRSIYVAKGYITENNINTAVDTVIIDFNAKSNREHWKNGNGEYGAFIIICILVIIGAAIHPFAVALFGLLGVYATFSFGMISIPFATFYSIAIGIVAIIIWRLK